MFGSVNGKRVRKSLDTVSWGRGEEILRETDPNESHEKIMMATATERFLADCSSRKLATETYGKYDLLCRELNHHFKGKPIRGISADDLARYRESWKMSAVSSGKKLERLRGFFRFCADRGWRKGNPAAGLKAPVAKHKPTLPLTKDDFEKILWACELFPTQGIYGKGNRIRVRAFVLLLRYSGLRIRDVVLLTDDKLVGNKLMLYSAKTGVPVFIPLPEEVVKQLAWAYELSPGKYFFWSGSGEVKSCVNDWQRTLGRLAKLSGVKFHAHMLRDTFAVELLQKGVSLENVATLLGNSTQIAEKHYSPWVKSRQDSLTLEIEKAWKLA
jgi:site-specific recombinase XerD